MIARMRQGVLTSYRGCCIIVLTHSANSRGCGRWRPAMDAVMTRRRLEQSYLDGLAHDPRLNAGPHQSAQRAYPASEG